MVRWLVGLLLAGALCAASGAQEGATNAAARKLVAANPMLEPLEATGDLARLIEDRRALRSLAEGLVEMHNPSALASVKPRLDDYFSQSAIGGALASQLAAPFDQGVLDLQLAWAISPRMQALHRALLDADHSRPVSGPAQLSAVRRNLLLRLIGTDMGHLAQARAFRAEWLGAALIDAIVPDSALLSSLRPSASAPGPGGRVEDLIAPALVAFGDDAITEYVEFAESEAGRRYFGQQVMLYGESGRRWYSDLVALLAAHARRAAPHVADVRALLADVDRKLAGPLRVTSARALRESLLAGEVAAPSNADIQQRLALIALRLQAEPDETGLRPPKGWLKGFEEIDARLARALEIDPRHAASLATQARSLFRQHRDAEARVALDRARAANPSDPWLPIYEADLLQAEGKHAEAVAVYESLLEDAEPGYRAQARSLIASRGAYLALDRGEDFALRMEALLVRHPGDEPLRWALGWHLIESNAPRERVLSAIAPLGESAARRALMQALDAKAMVAEIDSGEDAASTAQALLETARHSPGGIAGLVAQTCLDATGLERAVVLAEISGDKNALTRAIGCAVLHGQPRYIERLVAQGGDVNAESVPRFEVSPLYWAAYSNLDIETTRALLAAGAKPGLPGGGGRSLREKVASSALPDAKLVLQLFDAVDPEAAKAASERRIAHALRNAEAVPGGIPARIDAACRSGAEETMLEEAIALVESGEVSRAETTRLFGCLMMRHAPPIELLASHGADLDAPSIPGWDGTPLSRAADRDDVETFRRLLEAGADPEVPIPGKLSLRELLESRNTPENDEMLRLLGQRKPR